MVIIDKTLLHEKVTHFLQDNDTQQLKADPTDKYQKTDNKGNSTVQITNQPKGTQLPYQHTTGKQHKNMKILIRNLYCKC